MKINLSKVNVTLSKVEETVEFSLTEVNEAGMAYLVEYGLKQSLNDAMASAKTHDEATAAWKKRWDAIRNGTVATRSNDPLAKHIRALLSQKAKGWNDLDAKARNAMIAKVRDAEEGSKFYAILEVAQDNLRKEQALDTIELE